jgi:hypothetical protein
LVNPFEPPGLNETLTPECRVVPLDVEGVELDVENQEDHDRLDNDLLAQPAIPDFDMVLFSPETISAFESPERHAQALGMAKELLQQKDEIAELAYAQRIEKNPHDIERDAQLFGNVPGLPAICPQAFGSSASRCFRAPSLCAKG